MNYPLTFKKIFLSQYLFTGIRITAAAIIPAVILYHYNLLASMTAIPLGALIVGSTDSPGPFHLRRNTIIASICINFLVIIITISLQHNPVLIIIFIIVFGIFFSLAGVYGNRANSVGLVALLVFIFNIDSTASFNSAWYNGLLFTAGGTCYFITSLVLHQLRPYRYIQLQLGESLRSIAEYIERLSGLFKTSRDEDYLQNRLRQSQITIQQEQDSLREMLLSTREMIIDSTAKGRIIMMMFLDSVDLFERLISLQQDYNDIHKTFDDTALLNTIEQTMLSLQQELNAIGYAMQFARQSQSQTDIDKMMKALFDIFLLERKRHLSKHTLPLFIKMRQVIFALQEIAERIKRLHHLSSYEKMSSRKYKQITHAELKPQANELSLALLLENFTLQSSQFKHALRVTIGMVIGYSISLFFPLGHGYWIIMTIAIILKPAYSISRRRNKQRLLGTVTGVIIAFTFLYFIKNNTLAFLLLICAMVVAYSLLKLNYYISCVCITIYVLVSFHFLNNSNFEVIVRDRLLDTAIGCVIAFLISLTVFPVWEHEQTKELITALIKANKKYFNAVALLIKPNNKNESFYKLARKDAFVALANLSDNFQRILSEKRKKQSLTFYHQFVSSSYMFTAHIAALSTLLQRFEGDLNDKDFNPLINNINDKFKRIECAIKNQPVKQSASNRNAPITNKVQMLLQQRERELETGINDMQTTTRITLRELKSITDEFEIIDSIAADEIKIIQKIMQ